ncbi:MAG: TM2 domain-containing protein [Neisseriaceae bacterium]|nr:TM2 domain-containing protein [Neisseriaceae bacterium]
MCPPPSLPLNDIFHATTANGKNKNVAALLAFFLGSFGVHQFYLGRIGKGILYLLFCWTFIPSVLAIIDLILLLTMNNQTFNQKYGSFY